MSERPVFYYDFSSPYAYLAAERVNQVLPEPPVWRPIAYGFLIGEQGRVPWSMKPGRERDMREIERRADERGLPAIRWPPQWDDEPGENPLETRLAKSYSLIPLRAAVYAEQSQRLVEFSLAAFRQAFAAGRDLGDVDNVLVAASACELHPKAVLKGIETQSIKDRLRQNTEEAIRRGVPGIPTVAVGEELFWGDDRLEEAAVAVAT